MNPIKLEEVQKYVNENIGDFHNKRIRSLDRLKLMSVLRRKNPYLYKAKNLLTSEAIIKEIVDAHLSSSEEGIFGDWLEGLAIYINKKVFNGWKSGIPGIDLEFDNGGKRYIVNIKSGPNWGNRSQIDKLKFDFSSAKRTLRTSSSNLEIIAINGCCYGKNNKADRGEYFKYCGQRFWEFISGNSNLYLEIIEPLGSNAKIKTDEYQKLYSNMINRFTKEFSEKFCKENGEIAWEELVIFNSASITVKK